MPPPPLPRQSSGAFALVLSEQTVASVVVQTSYLIAREVQDVPLVRVGHRSGLKE